MKMTIEETKTWLKNAQPGDKTIYHQGCLAIDRSFNSDATRVVDQIANLFLDQSKYTRGGVYLVQKRYGPWKCDYIAIKQSD